MEDGKLNGEYEAKPRALMVAQYGEESDGTIFCCTERLIGWTSGMENACPESRIISIEDGVWCNENGSRWKVRPEMLYGPYFDWGEECEVRGGKSEAWEVASFRAYCVRNRHDDNYIVTAGGERWKYIRRPQKEHMSHETPTVEELAQAHMAGQNHAGCVHASYGDAHAWAYRVIAGRKSMESEE